MTPEELIVAGDFTTEARMWGYKRDNDRGCNVLTHTKQAKLRLLNGKQTATCIGKLCTENDTTIDFTWAIHNLQARCRTAPDALGSSHLPVEIELMTERHPNTKCQVRLINLAPKKCLGERIMKAKSTQEYQVKQDDPGPNLHLLNLVASRLEAQQCYRRNKV